MARRSVATPFDGSKAVARRRLREEAKVRKAKAELRRISVLAASIQDEDQLNFVLGNVQGGPDMRAAVRKAILPFLKFTPKEGSGIILVSH